MFVAGLAAVEKLRMERPEAVERVQAMAGLSLGEYTALTAAGVFTFEDGLKLVKLRGEAMQDATVSGNQGMLAVGRFAASPMCCFPRATPARARSGHSPPSRSS